MDQLPEDCICSILAFTSPKDVCRSAAASSTFRSAADSDALWNTFLPADYQQIFSQASPSSSPLLLNSLSKKALYFYLCDHPILTGIGKSSFALEKESGKMCYMIGARDLHIRTEIVTSVPRRKWKYGPQSRSSEMALVFYDKWGDIIKIYGRIDSRKLTPKTNYAVYLIFILVGCRHQPVRQRLVQLSLDDEGIEFNGEKILPFDKIDTKVPRKRGDGWMEIEMGQIFNELGEFRPITVSAMEVVLHNCAKCGLVIEGIEIRAMSQ